MNNAGTNLRTIRQQMGLSIRALEDATGVDDATISRIETGKQQLTEKLAVRFASALHISVSMLYAEAGIVESAVVQGRKAPLLDRDQLTRWKGPDGFEEVENQKYYRLDTREASRLVFAWLISDKANEPDLKPGDILWVDPEQTPQLGSTVVGQDSHGDVFVGRYRAGLRRSSPFGFDIVPVNTLYPSVRSAQDHIELRGVAIFFRRPL